MLGSLIQVKFFEGMGSYLSYLDAIVDVNPMLGDFALFGYGVTR